MAGAMSSGLLTVPRGATAPRLGALKCDQAPLTWEDGRRCGADDVFPSPLPRPRHRGGSTSRLSSPVSSNPSPPIFPTSFTPMAGGRRTTHLVGWPFPRRASVMHAGGAPDPRQDSARRADAAARESAEQFSTAGATMLDMTPHGGFPTPPLFGAEWEASGTEASYAAPSVDTISEVEEETTAGRSAPSQSQTTHNDT